MDAIENQRCDASASERAAARVTLIGTMGVLHLCRHPVNEFAAQYPGEYEIAYAMETVGS